MAFGGRYITCGLYNQHLEYTSRSCASIPKLDRSTIAMILMKNLTIMGNCIGTTADLENALCDYSNGRLNVVIDSVFRGTQVAEFFERSFSAPDRLGKVVYRFE